MTILIMLGCSAVLVGCVLYVLFSKRRGPNHKTSAQEGGLLSLLDDAFDLTDELDDVLS